MLHSLKRVTITKTQKMLDTLIRKAIILVGGEGTRLRPLTYSTTKAMMPVLNIPFIERVITYLSGHGVSDIVLAMGYRPDSISRHFAGRDRGITNLLYSIEEQAMGTAGAVKNGERYIEPGETFFVLNGDIFTDLDLQAMQRFHREKNASVTIALTPVEDPSQYGVVERDDAGRVTHFTEKPAQGSISGNLINAGTYIMDTGIFEYIPEHRFCMFEKDVFPELIARSRHVYGYSSDAYWMDMGTPRKYLQLNRDLLLGKSKDIQLGESGWQAGEKTKVHPEAQVRGPAVVGPQCTIGKGAVVNGPSVIGACCTISDYAFIDSSIIMNSTCIGAHAKVVGSILSSGLMIGKGESVENSVIAMDPAAAKTVTSQL